MSKHLLGALMNPRTTPAEAQDPIRYLLQLQTDGAASLRGQNPVRLYLDTQAWRHSRSPRIPCGLTSHFLLFQTRHAHLFCHRSGVLGLI